MQESVNEERPKKIFADVREVEITKAIANEFHSVLIDRAESDVIIIGAGPAGLTAGRELSNMGFKVFKKVSEGFVSYSWPSCCFKAYCQYM